MLSLFLGWNEGVAIVVVGLVEARVQVGVSPLVELGSALHVLGRPGHHGREEWARGVRDGMSPALVEQTRAWMWATQAIRATPFVSVEGIPEQADFSAQVERIRRTAAEELARQLLRPVSGSRDPAAARRWGRSRGPAVTALVDMLIDRPHEGVARFLDFLEASWREWFRDEWHEVRAGLAQRSRKIEDSLQRFGTAAALASLDPAVTVRGGGGKGVVIAKVQSKRHDVSRRGLSIAASAFIHPHVYVADVPGQPLLLILPADPEPDPRPVPPAPVLLSRLAVLAHAGRLEICRAIASEPRTAGEIAALWSMDSTQVTRHLRSLASEGLVRATRQGRFVRYALDLEVVESLGVDLVRLLLR
jgi:DNA-binding transcriptional ArsR family regulator